MNLKQIQTKIKSFFGGSEGSVRGPFYGQGDLGHWFELGGWEDGFQRNLEVRNTVGIAALHAAISAYVNAFILMPMEHRKKLPTGGWEVSKSSALSRWIHRPNYYQTISEFWSIGIRNLMDTGNAVAVSARNERFEVVSTLWVDSYSFYRDEDTDGIYYHVSLHGREMVVPARDILHLRINAPASNPLQGRSHTVFCAHSLATNATLSSFLQSYLNNRGSPSYALTTDVNLSATQMSQLRAAWNEQSKQLASGGTPILGSGLKPEMLGVPPGDALLIDTFNLTVEDIARAFSIPKALLGIDETASNAENLYRAWISLGLGSLVEQIEQSIESLFGLKQNEEVNFDANAMLRLDASAQMEIVSKGVTSGILSPDEGREHVGFGPIDGGFGEVPAMQQQMIPLDLLHELHVADIASKTNANNVAQEPPPLEPPPEPEQKSTIDYSLLTKGMLAEKRKT